MSRYVQLKAAAEWDAKEVAQAPYTMKHMAGPQVTGTALVVFRLLCENTFTHRMLYALYMSKNGMPPVLSGTVIPEAPKTSGVPEPLRPERGVIEVADPGSPAARVRAALAAIGAPAAAAPAPALGSPRRGGRGKAAAKAARPTILDYHRAYLSGEVSPVDAAEAIIKFLDSEPASANWFCEFASHEHLRAQAAASAARYAAGRPLSVLDGVPFAVKDVVDVLGHTSGGGTAFLGALRGPIPDVAYEAPSVAALRSLGAVCCGKTQMQEFGLLPTGISAKLGLARNPHCQDCIPGGSSGGSACVVAAGVVPFSIGTDGGGSVRIPAALCGVIGFKPTQGRMASDPEGSTLVAMGPITTCMTDTLIVYAAMACPGSCFKSPLAGGVPRNEFGGFVSQPGRITAATAKQAQAEVDAAARAAAAAAAAPPPEACLGESAATRPALTLPARVLPEGVLVGGRGGSVFKARPLAGVRIGIYKPWFEDAECCVVSACDGVVSLLRRMGAELVDITLPEIDHIRIAHMVTFLSECYALQKRIATTPELCSQLHEDSRVILTAGGGFTSADYLQAARLRRRQGDHWRRAFEICDFVATPTTACVAPRIAMGAEVAGLLDMTQCGLLVRFTAAANVLGLPALALPVGRDPAGACSGCGVRGDDPDAPQLPASFQLIGQPWHDAELLKVGFAVEEALAESGVPVPVPPVYVNPLARPAAAASPRRGGRGAAGRGGK
ncbi:fatty acid amide hydrolase-like [Raphidocelis subcapitata]|uniref:Fatty acid amide hydrolase-like n=1 Tax=Raphidocelis subcapitata TaxID=307507 RepID=A0A2V0PDG5_9CHLO|nr:fatty acid amide hydrolase-like [Raphidocelis subcapitata]|eukprot:GBF95943.1 fatty acid amide hydrolase-like [Raphidocelis subcapitata]